MSRPPLVTACCISTNTLVISTGAATLYTPGIACIFLLMAAIWLRSEMVTR